MESNYRNREFEQFVKHNADQHRMYPLDKVWKGVNNALHSRRKWYGYWLGLLLLITGSAVTWVMISNPESPIINPVASGNLEAAAPPSETNKDEDAGSHTSTSIEKLLPFKQNPQKSAIDIDLIDPVTPVYTPEDLVSGKEPNNITRVDDIISGNEPVAIAPLSHEPPAIQFFPKQFTKLFVKDPATPSLENLTPAAQQVKSIPSEGNTAVYLQSIESVLNIYKYKRPRKTISWQLFVTPTISYRRLSLNRAFDNPSGYPFAPLSGDVNSAVTHKPDLGMQIGLAGRYPITKNLRIRTGFQFNINRYDIKAYAFNGEVAIIDLNGSPGNNKITTWTYYRNFNGYRSDWLKNYYFSVATPIGAELTVLGNRKTSVGVAGTIQPTYILNDRAFLISTDYKNYAEVPRLIRHVNLNSSFEAFINYTSGNTNWQIGPQVRYQLLSSFHDKYPIKENLFDFGLKIGVTLNK